MEHIRREEGPTFLGFMESWYWSIGLMVHEEPKFPPKKLAH